MGYVKFIYHWLELRKVIFICLWTKLWFIEFYYRFLKWAYIEPMFRSQNLNLPLRDVPWAFHRCNNCYIWTVDSRHQNLAEELNRFQSHVCKLPVNKVTIILLTVAEDSFRWDTDGRFFLHNLCNVNVRHWIKTGLKYSRSIFVSDI